MISLDNLESLANRTRKAFVDAGTGGSKPTGRVAGLVPIPSWVRNQVGQGGDLGQSARNLLGDFLSTVGKERSGGAITPQEFTRLETFLPTVNDDPGVILSKMRTFLTTLAEIKKNRVGAYQKYGKGGMAATAGNDQGFALPNPEY